MASALLSLLLSSAGAVLLPPSVAVLAEDAGSALPVPPQGMPSAGVGVEAVFGQMLAEYRSRPDRPEGNKQILPVVKSVPSAGGDALSATTKALPPVLTGVVPPAAVLPGASTEAAFGQIPVRAGEAAREGAEESAEPEQGIPPINPAALSLVMPVVPVAIQRESISSVAYTTEAEMATVAVFDARVSAAPMPSAPQDATAPAAFPELAARTMPQLPPVATEAEAGAETEVSDLPAVHLPRVAVAARNADSPPVGGTAHREEQEASAEERRATPMLPLTAAALELPVKAVAAPPTASVARKAEAGQVDAVAGAGRQATPSLGKSPVVNKDTPVPAKDSVADSAAIYRPLGDADTAAKPEATVKTSPPEGEDSSRLLTHKAGALSAPAGDASAQSAVHSHAAVRQEDAPPIKLASAPPHLPVQEQIAVRIRQAKDDGADHISLRLDPPELGKLHIRLEIAQDGRAQVVVTADNRDTLDMLQRDVRGLERALADAGVKAESGSMQFNLQQQSGQGAAANPFGFEGRPGGRGADAADEKATASIESVPLAAGEAEYLITAGEGVDISV